MKDKLVVRQNGYKKIKLNKLSDDYIDTLIVKDKSYYANTEYDKNININNFVIDYKFSLFNRKSHAMIFNDLNAKNIYFKGYENIGGITLSIDCLTKNNINRINFCWHSPRVRKSKITEINVIIFGMVKKIKLPDEIQEIHIYKTDSPRFDLVISIENTNSRKKYIIDWDGNINEELMYHSIEEKDLDNGVLDLRKFNELYKVSLCNINIDTLIVNKSIIKDLHEIDLYDYVYIEKIKIIDDNKMRLFPDKEIYFNDNLDIYFDYITGDEGEVLIYLDKDNNLKVYSRKEILKDNFIEDVYFLKEDEEMIILYKYKRQGKYKVIIDEKEYNIDKLFNLFIQSNILEYKYNFSSEFSMEGYDLINLFENHISSEQFIKMYDDYNLFKLNLKKLHDIGFSYKYFVYLHNNGMDDLVNLMCRHSSTFLKYKKEEVEKITSISKRLVKNIDK